jgi:SprT protein
VIKPFFIAYFLSFWSMTEQHVLSILQHHLPAQAVAYCLQLWKEKPFTLKITKSRLTKIGDFTSRKDAARPQITLNSDLNPYTFLITYIHEVAHLHVFVSYGNRVEPHGEHWKIEFQRLMTPLFSLDIFPEEVLIPLMDHMENPKASSFADVTLTKALRGFDQHANTNIVLSDLPEGSIFELHGRYFKKGILRRTRVVCNELNSKRSYLVPAEALVTNVQLSLL